MVRLGQAILVGASGNQISKNHVTMSKPPYPNRLDEQMNRVGMKNATLARLIETTEQQIGRLRKGTREMTVSWATRLAPAVGVPWHTLLEVPSEHPVSSDPQVVLRFAAAIEALYGEDKESAAEALNVDVPLLLSLADGTRPISQQMMVRFCDVSGCPADWLLRGIVSAIFPEEAMIRLLTLFPDLVSDRAKRRKAST
jgi:plasmid maintenance system antidote protein VapI